jgi:hypothetical protein
MADMPKLFKLLTGGRPMMRNGLAFRDAASGAFIYFWVDTLGRRWLAEDAWSLRRVPVGHGERVKLPEQGNEGPGP